MKLCFTNEKAVEAWFDRVTKCGPNDPQLDVYSPGRRIIAQGHVLYSYGTHFPMVRWLPERRLFLTNTTERHSSSTSIHQSYVRRNVPRHIEVGPLIVYIDPSKAPDEFLDRWSSLLRQVVAKRNRARRHKQWWDKLAEQYIHDRKRFVEAFNLDAPELPEDVTAALVTLKLAA